MTACSNMSGNVVPEKGPTMEDVYDSMVTAKSPPSIPDYRTKSLAITTSNFYKLPNPELNMYVYPHLAGQDELPIPGYSTVFNAYERDHFALPNEVIRI